MTNRDVKFDLIEALASRGVYYRQVDDTEFVTRCPYCGDSTSNYNTGHLYFKIDTENNTPVMYNCFKCSEQGILTEELLGLLGISDINIKSGIHTLNKTCDRADRKSILEGDDILNFDYIIPKQDLRHKKILYLVDRIGKVFDRKDIEDMKVVTSIKDFLEANNITTPMMDPYIMKILDRDYVGFLSSGNSHLLLRDTSKVWRVVKDNSYYKKGKNGMYYHFQPNERPTWNVVKSSVIKELRRSGQVIPDTEHSKRWVKYPITKESQKNRIFYTMRSEIDILADGDITVNMSEGILDTLSAAYNLGYDNPNTLNLTVGGKYYEKMILYIVSLGLVGSNIHVNIFADNDQEFNAKAKGESTTIKYYRNLFKRYKYLFGSMTVYYNTLDKDIGVPKDKIALKSYRL